MAALRLKRSHCKLKEQLGKKKVELNEIDLFITENDSLSKILFTIRYDN
jgi:hypothetical protein